MFIWMQIAGRYGEVKADEDEQEVGSAPHDRLLVVVLGARALLASVVQSKTM